MTAPEKIDFIFTKYRICCQQNHALSSSLRNEQAIEGISVMHGKIVDGESMLLRNRQGLDRLRG